MMKKQYVKAETEIVPMKTESFMQQVTATVQPIVPGSGDPDPEEPPARAHNDVLEYFFEPTPPPQQKKNNE